MVRAFKATEVMDKAIKAVVKEAMVKAMVEAFKAMVKAFKVIDKAMKTMATKVINAIKDFKARPWSRE